MQTFQQARENVEVALAEKFGKDPKQPPTMLQNLKRTKDIQIINQDSKDKDKIALTVWITEDHDKDRRILESNWYAVKDGDAWRLLVPYSGGKTRPVTKKKGSDGKETLVHVFEPRTHGVDESGIGLSADDGAEVQGAHGRIGQSHLRRHLQESGRGRKGPAKGGGAVSQNQPPASD